MAGPLPPPRQAALRILRHPVSRAPLDQALVLYFAAPASETGEDVAELQVHGGKAVVTAVLAALAEVPGCRPAEPGEFVRRAFDNGKLDLTAAEGLADLIDAETEGQRSQALLQASGALARRYEAWRQQLTGALALVEAALDFADEPDVADNAVSQAEQLCASLRQELLAHLDDANRGEILREGYRVVLAGPPNAGKSSLLNALARRDVAIVSEEAGTTRDLLEVRLDLAGLPVIVTDTAGIREATGAVEREGIRRTRERASTADLVVWLTDASAAATPPPADLTEAAVLVVASKADLAHAARDAGTDLMLSALTGQGLDALTRRIGSLAQERLAAAADSAPITRQRHRHQLQQAADALAAFAAANVPDLELRAEELRLAATALGRITGRIDVEDVLDQVFGRFCIGK